MVGEHPEYEAVGWRIWGEKRGLEGGREGGREGV